MGIVVELLRLGALTTRFNRRRWVAYIGWRRLVHDTIELPRSRAASYSTYPAPFDDTSRLYNISAELKEANLNWHKALDSSSYCTPEGNGTSTVFTSGQIVNKLCQPFEELSVRSKGKQ